MFKKLLKLFKRNNNVKKSAFVETFKKAEHDFNFHAKGFGGEKLACEWLLGNGYEILEQNFFAVTGEIDIVAKDKNKVIHFVEVKTRYSDKFGTPAESVTKSKQRKITNTAIIYMRKHRIYSDEFVFSIMEVLFDKNNVPHLNFLENAFSGGRMF